jgi:hypothetical protein
MNDVDTILVFVSAVMVGGALGYLVGIGIASMLGWLP